MTISEFIDLNMVDQANLAMFTGNYLIERQTPLTYRMLYSVDKFFVEVVYSRKISEITKVIPFIGISRLDPYLLNIDVDSNDRKR